MNLSPAGRDRIKGYEGYGKELPDGRCTAYQDTFNGNLDKPTIGWGCTEGVTMGMVWTVEEAEAALTRELETFEAAVTRLVTVELNQNEFDALVALSYNIGVGALGSSTVLKKLNAGDRIGAAEAFKLFNKAGGGVVAGLVSRRNSEAGLFLRPVDGVASMPQTVTASAEPMSARKAAVLAAPTAAAAATIVQAVAPLAPAVPAAKKAAAAVATGPSTELTDQLALVQATGAKIAEFATWAQGNPILVGATLAVMGVFFWWSKKQEKTA